MEIRNNIHLHTRQIIGIFPVLELDSDDVDIPLRNPSISYLDIFFLVSSIVMHIVDMGIDISLAVRYLLANKITYFAWTATFIFLPSFINVIISRRMQHQDDKVKMSRRVYASSPSSSSFCCRPAHRRICLNLNAYIPC